MFDGGFGVTAIQLYFFRENLGEEWSMLTKLMKKLFWVNGAVR